MEKVENNKEYYSIDLLHIFKMLWRRVWIIIIVGVLCATLGFSVASYAIHPKYSASIMLYVNNTSKIGNTEFSISTSEITAAQSLVKTYIVILRNRTTLEDVIKQAGVSYSATQLNSMIEAGPVEDTEVFRVKVTTENAEEAVKIANTISTVLTTRVGKIIEGASMQIVDTADIKASQEPVSPSETKYTAIGLILGSFISALFAIMDDTIHDEEYVNQTYEYPILAKIPDLLDGSSKEYSYYSQKKSANK